MARSCQRSIGSVSTASKRRHMAWCCVCMHVNETGHAQRLNMLKERPRKWFFREEVDFLASLAFVVNCGHTIDLQQVQAKRFSFKVARNEVENASFAQRSAHRDSRIWRPELIEPAAERKRRARRRRPTFKSAYPDPQILPQCNISSNYPL